MNVIFWCLCAAAVLAMAIYYLTRYKRLKTAVFGTFTGILALLILNCFGEKWGADLPLNIFNLCGSAVLGVPFVICIVIINFL